MDLFDFNVLYIILWECCNFFYFYLYIVVLILCIEYFLFCFIICCFYWYYVFYMLFLLILFFFYIGKGYVWVNFYLDIKSIRRNKVEFRGDIFEKF